MPQSGPGAKRPMQIERYHRQVRPVESAGNVIHTPSNSWDDVAKIGETFTDFGFKAQQEILDARRNSEISSAIVQAERRFQDHKSKLNPDDTASWLDDFDKLKYDDILANVTDDRAKAYLGTKLEELKSDQRKEISNYRLSVDAHNISKKYYQDFRAFGELASKAENPKELQSKSLHFIDSMFGLELTEEGRDRLENGRDVLDVKYFEGREDYYNPALINEEVRKSELRNWLLYSRELYDTEQKKQFIASQLQIALSKGDDGESYIKGLSGLPTEDKKRMVSDYNFYRKKAEDDRDEKYKTNETELYLQIRRGELTDPSVIDTKLENDEISLSAHKSLVKYLEEGPGGTNDVRVESGLEKKALAISTGAVKYEDFRNEVTEAAFGDKPTIDDKAFESLMSIANREYKTYQANAMGEAIDYGLRQLTYTDEQVTNMILTPAFAELSSEEKGKRIMSIKRLAEENFSQYKRAMNEWFQAEVAAGRDPDDDEIYVKSRKIARLYRERVISEQIYNELNPEDAERIRGLRGFFVGMPGKAGQFEGKTGITIIETKEQFEALPAGAVFIAPDGSKRIKK